MKTLDARGCACPEPVVMTRNAILEDATGVRILVDNACAVENITRFAGNAGYAVAVDHVDGDIRLTLTKQ